MIEKGFRQRREFGMDYKNTVKLHTILTVLTLVILLLPLSQGDFFGSEGDWYSQHVGAAENLRQTMLNTGSLFPQFSTGGGGCNIYDLAYYGLLRPDVLFSCLVPNLEMKYIIAGYALLGVIASVNLCYIWLRRQKLAPVGRILRQRIIGSSGLLLPRTPPDYLHKLYAVSNIGTYGY